MKVVLASQNRHKLEELQAILSHYGLDIILESDLGLDIEVDETGTTFEENSMLKAKAVMEQTELPTIADDSGLMIDALNGAPGVYSARYGGSEPGLVRVLREMADVPMEQRCGRFVCVITLLEPNGRCLVAKGTCEGVITTEAKGNSGFGYDPIFFVPEENCTFAEMSAERKNEISHRANALKELVRLLQEETNDHK